MRMGGLASGMDTDSIVKDMMKVAKMPLDKLNQEKQWTEWQQEDLREINKSLFDFRDKLFDLRLERTFNAKGASSSNDKLVTVTADNSATAGSYELSVQSLAKGAFITSLGKIGSSFEPIAGELKLNGVTISFDEDIKSFEQIAREINNHEKQTGVRASYDKTTDRFFFSTTLTGEDAKIDFAGTTGTGLDFLNNTIKVGTNIDGEGQVSGVPLAEGADASITLNGAELKMAENKFTINGLSYDLKGVSTTENPTTSIVITNDNDAVFDRIKEFVDTYNELLEQINGKLNENQYRSYHVLSSEEKESLSDKEVELWQEKARSGTLRSDSTLRGLVNKMRMSTASFIETDSEYNSLRSIGIATQSYHEGGKLYLDEDQLRKALSEDPEGVQKLFTASSENGKAVGIGANLYEVVNNGTRDLVEKAGRTSIKGIDDSFLGKRLKNMEKSIANWEARLMRTEDRYWRQFTAMEKALAQMNSQSNWLYQQFS